MLVTGSIRTGIRAVGIAVRVVVWCVETLWLGIAGLWKAGRFVLRARRAFSLTMRCPRGHAVESFGAFRCGKCQAVFEGHAFDPCPACAAKTKFVPCPTCALSIQDPSR